MVSENNEDDCIALLTHLAEHGYSSLSRVGEAVGLSKDEVRRYLLPETTDARDANDVAEWKKYRPKRYWKAIENFDGERLNTSKHDYLRHYAYVYGFALVPTSEYPFVEVRNVREHGPSMRTVIMGRCVQGAPQTSRRDGDTEW